MKITGYTKYKNFIDDLQRYINNSEHMRNIIMAYEYKCIVTFSECLQALHEIEKTESALQAIKDFKEV